MRGDDLRNLKEEDEERERSDGEREEKDSVALVAEERKRVVDEAEEAAAVPKTVAAMDLVEIEFFEAAAMGDECDGSVSCRDKGSAIWGFPFLRPLSFCLGSTWPTQKPCLATRFCNSNPPLGFNPN